MQKTVQEPAKTIPVVYDCDVVIAGAGIAGVFAAIASGRLGARTVLIDRFGSPGGNMGPGMIVGGSFRAISPDPKFPFPRGVFRGPSGIPWEFFERYAALGGGAIPPYRDNYYPRDSNNASKIAFEMMDEAGVTLMLSSYAGDPIVEDGVFKGLFVENKSGRQAVSAKVVVDATGEADLARRAGLPVIQPKKENHKMDKHAPNGMGIWASFGGVDFDRFERLQKEPFSMEDKDLGELGKISVGKGLKFEDLRKGGWFDRNAGMAGFRTGLVRPDSEYDSGNGEHITELEKQTRLHIYDVLEYYRKNVSGFEGAYVHTIAPFLGTRGGPCIEGEYTLTTENCMKESKFDDVVYIYGEGQTLRRGVAEMGRGVWVDVPYRVMIPIKGDGLLAVGRSASCIPDTLLRGRFAVLHMGQVGGAAAALSAKNDVTPRKLEVKQLQKYLLDEGYFLGSRKRLEELGLA